MTVRLDNIKLNITESEDKLLSIARKRLKKSLKNLKIIKKFALMPNAQVENCSAGYLGGELALFTAQINFVYNLRTRKTLNSLSKG